MTDAIKHAQEALRALAAHHDTIATRFRKFAADLPDITQRDTGFRLPELLTAVTLSNAAHEDEGAAFDQLTHAIVECARQRTTPEAS